MPACFEAELWAGTMAGSYEGAEMHLAIFVGGHADSSVCEGANFLHLPFVPVIGVFKGEPVSALSA